METNTQEVPRERWGKFLTEVSRQCQNWRVTIEVIGQELGDQRAAAGLPLQGLTLETKGPKAGDILIEAGDLGVPPFMIHHVARPRCLRAAHTQSGAETDLQIENDQGIVTLVRLQPQPELPPGAAAQARA
jgi:hypothetical protein